MMSQDKNIKPLHIEIWSDIQCPFCYIGKTQLDQAIADLGMQNEVQIQWKSYQLDPSLPQQGLEDQKVYEYLAQRKGWSIDQSKAMHQQVAERAEQEGLHFDFEKSVIANSFLAHRILQKANEVGLGHKGEEQFFKAYFTDGKHLGHKEDLMAIGATIGLDAAQVEEALSHPAYADRVKADMEEAQSLGVTGVPFFVLNRQYAVSGAQGVEVFKEVLTKVRDRVTTDPSIGGESCSIDGNC